MRLCSAYLGGFGGALAAELEVKVNADQGLQRLERWLDAAVTAVSLAEVLRRR